MRMLTLAASPEMHRFVRGFEDVAGVIGVIVVLVVMIEAISMIPDLIRTIRMHWM
jgi:hypothetical protein